MLKVNCYIVLCKLWGIFFLFFDDLCLMLSYIKWDGNVIDLFYFSLSWLLNTFSQNYWDNCLLFKKMNDFDRAYAKPNLYLTLT